VPAKQKSEGLLKAAWEMIERDCDETAFLEWRKTAVEYLTEMLGAEHYYTSYFGDEVTQVDTMALLMGTGVLSAARETMINGKCKLLSHVGV